MESHKKVLGIIFIVSAVLQALIMLVLSFFISTAFSFAISQSDSQDLKILELIMGIFEYLPAIVVIFLSLPTLVAGIGLVTGQKWAMIVSLIVGCLKLFSFPVGTSIGIYAIWVYAEDSKASKAAALGN
jgi:hypothetical protein